MVLPVYILCWVYVGISNLHQKGKASPYICPTQAQRQHFPTNPAPNDFARDFHACYSTSPFTEDQPLHIPTTTTWQQRLWFSRSNNICHPKLPFIAHHCPSPLSFQPYGYQDTLSFVITSKEQGTISTSTKKRQNVAGDAPQCRSKANK